MWWWFFAGTLACVCVCIFIYIYIYIYIYMFFFVVFIELPFLSWYIASFREIFAGWFIKRLLSIPHHLFLFVVAMSAVEFFSNYNVFSVLSPISNFLLVYSSHNKQQSGTYKTTPANLIFPFYNCASVNNWTDGTTLPYCHAVIIITIVTVKEY